MTLRIVRQATQDELLARGVWYAAFHSRKGNRVLLAIDRQGRLVRHIVLRSGVVEWAAIEWLWRALDHFDPEPSLEVQRPHEAPRHIDPTAELTPSEYSTYLLKLRYKSKSHAIAWARRAIASRRRLS